jgi:DNA-directed RNA polymerase II subunit RPB1
METCNGHPGHIELPYPVYHIEYINTILKILRCVCFWCCRILVNPDDPMVKAICGELNNERNEEEDGGDDNISSELTGKARFNAICHLCKTRKICLWCEGKQPIYEIPSKRSSLVIDIRWDKTELQDPNEIEESKKPFTTREALLILRAISDEDYKLLGFNPEETHPSWWIITNLSVSVPRIRPSITESEGSRNRGQDDLTLKLKLIVNAVNEINKYYDKLCNQYNISREDVIEKVNMQEINLPPKLISELQYEVATYINNDIKGQKPSTQRKSGAPTKSITSKFGNKEGLLRGNLMGKRVNFSARSVISPDPNIDIDEIGVPYETAMQLTYPEAVFDANIKELEERIRLGPNHINGAKTVIDQENKMLQLYDDKLITDIQLKVGYKVERHLKNGDVVVYNRQPSLHKASMMGHRVKLMPGKTFRLHPNTTTPYNADFDGDEMNFHVPQSEGTRSEVYDLMGVHRSLVSAQSNRPIIGLVQDALVGVFLLTRKNVFLNREEFSQLLSQIKYDISLDTEICNTTKHPEFFVRSVPQPAILKPYPLWTGKQLVTMCLPKKIHLKKKVRGYDDSDPMDIEERYVVIEDGELLCGSLCKKTIGPHASGGIVHVLFEYIGPRKTLLFLGDIQRIVNMWLSWRGLSVGMQDCTATPNMKKQIDKIHKMAEEKIQQVYYFARAKKRKFNTNVNDNNTTLRYVEGESDEPKSKRSKLSDDLGEMVIDNIELEGYIIYNHLS